MPEFGSPHSDGAAAATTVSSEPSICPLIRETVVLKHCGMLQLSEAMQILVEAVSAASSDTADAVLQQAIANVCIRKGLRPLTACGYELHTIYLSWLGVNIACRCARAATYASTKLKRLVQDTAGFTVSNNSVSMDITKLIPNPSAEVRSLLPTVTWPEPGGSGSSSSTFLSPSSSNNASSPPDAQASADQQLDPVYSMLDLLPSEVAAAVKHQLGFGAYAQTFVGKSGEPSATKLTDIIADSGRPVRLRFGCTISAGSQAREQELPVTMDLRQALCNLSVLRSSEGSGATCDMFQDSNRMGVSQTLHRISALKNRYGDVCGLTYRIGRHIPGVADSILDVVAKVASSTGSQQSPGSLLLIGPPGVGKTTLLRDITRQLADAFHELVMVVDTSEEIAGGGDLPHSCIGLARRMLGTRHQSKYEVLEEAVANHGPEVIVVDEIGNAKEVAAIKDIASRGVTMVATVHGTTLQHLLENPVLSPLVGGKQRMVIGDSAAAQMQNGRKTRSERLEMPTFSTVIEVQDRHTWLVHGDVAASVDNILAGSAPATDCRQNV